MIDSSKTESISLSEFNRHIGQQLKVAMPGLYWIAAEINEMRVTVQGHCFMELVEKASQGEQIIAKADARIWAYHFRMLSPYFETVTGQSLAAGLKVMLQVNVEFHELYGMSLQVTDINPAFTVGDLATQKQAVIRKLTEEGVIDINRGLELSLVPQRIAVISSETAAGYGDFIDQLSRNSYGYAFRHVLFPAVMQGKEAESSIIDALDRIFEHEEEFDVVVVIRGGGAQSDLNCFNSYRLTCCMAQFPLPLITGIGHDRDETIADRVACVSLKTPTAAAEFIINKALLFDRRVNELAQHFVEAVGFVVQTSKSQLDRQSRRLQVVMQSFLHAGDKDIREYCFRLFHAASAILSKRRFERERLQVSVLTESRKAVRNRSEEISRLSKLFGKTHSTALSKEQNKILWLEDKLRLSDPAELLRRGYGIVLSNGKLLRDIRSLKKGQRIETVLHGGKIESIVEETIPNHSLPSSTKL